MTTVWVSRVPGSRTVPEIVTASVSSTAAVGSVRPVICGATLTTATCRTASSCSNASARTVYVVAVPAPVSSAYVWVACQVLVAERATVLVAPSPQVTVTTSPTAPPTLRPLATRAEPSSTSDLSRFSESTLVGPGGGVLPVQPPGSEVVSSASKVSCSASSAAAGVTSPAVARSSGSSPVMVTTVPIVWTSNLVSLTVPPG